MHNKAAIKKIVELKEKKKKKEDNSKNESGHSLAEISILPGTVAIRDAYREEQVQSKQIFLSWYTLPEWNELQLQSFLM